MIRSVRAALVAVLVTLATAPTAHADDDAPIVTPEHRQANALYKEGVRLYNAGDYAAALDLFQTAHGHYPAPVIEYSIASTLKVMGRTVDAANAYQRFIDDPAAEKQFVTEAHTLLTVLDTMVARVEISTDGAVGELQVGDGAWVLVEGTLVVRVAPGTYVVRGRRTGFVADYTGKLAAGSAERVTLRWHEVAAAKPRVIAPVTAPAIAPPSLHPAPAARHRGRGRTLAAISLAGGGVVLAGASAMLELAARHRLDDAHALCGPALRCDDPELGQARALTDQAGTRRGAAIAAGAVGGVAIAASVVLWLTAPAEARIRVAPIADAHTVGVLAAGHF